MATSKYTPYTLALFVAMLFSLSGTALAYHEASVAGEIVPLADASLGHGENCDDVHYHGDLNGKPDPAPDGCGHGIITILSHNEDDESIVPETTKESTEDKGPSILSRIGSFLGDIVDVVAQAFGAPPPKTISDSVDITLESSEGIAENIENIENYREAAGDEDTLNIYDTSTEDLEEGSLAKRFFDWVNNIGK